MALASIAGIASASPSFAYEITKIGTGDAALSMNARGQFVVGTFDDDERRPKSLRVYSGDVRAPLPRPFNFAVHPESESLNLDVLPNGIRIVTWDGSASEFRYKNHSAIFSGDPKNARVRSIKALPAFSFLQPPSLAVGSRGDAALFWAWSRAKKSFLYASFRTPTGRFSNPIRVQSENDSESISGIQGGIDRRGNPSFVWGANTVSAVTGDGRGGFGRVQQMRGFRNCSWPLLEVAPSGAAIVAASCGNAIKYAVKKSGRRFGAVHSLARSASLWLGDPTLLSLADGRVIMAWNASDQKGSRIDASIGVAGQRMSKPVALTSMLEYAAPPPDDVSATPPSPTEPTAEPTGESGSGTGVGVPTTTNGGGTDWSLQLLVGPGGRPYISSRLNSEQSIRVAPIERDLTLGQSTLVVAQLDWVSVQLSDSGAGIALWDDRLEDEFRTEIKLIQFDAPVP